MTIKDIAKECGVSVSTVSRALNAHPDINEETRVKILETVEKYSYIPNTSARMLAKYREKSIGVIVRGIGNIFFDDLVRIIEDRILKAGYGFVLQNIGINDNELLEGAKLIAARRLSGIIFLGGRFDYHPEDLRVLDIPFVFCTYDNSFGSLPKDMYSSVSIDDEKEAMRAVSYLLEKGYKKIATLVSETDDYSVSELRYRGYKRALEEVGIDLDRDLVLEARSYDMKDSYQVVKAALEEKSDFDALFVCSDSMAIAAMKAIHDMGKKVPDDIGVLSIDGLEISDYIIPSLSSMVQPRKKIGEEAVRIILSLISNKGRNKQVNLKTTLRSGGSIK